MAKPRQLSGYKEYCSPGCNRRLIDPSKSPSQIRSALQKIYKVTKSLESKVNLLHNLLMAKSTYDQIKRRKSIPANITSRVVTSCRKLGSAVSFVETQEQNVEGHYKAIDDALRQALHALTTIENIIKSANLFFPLTKGKSSEKAALIVDLVTMAYGQVIDTNAYIEKAIEAENKREEAPEERPATNAQQDTGLGSFVEQLRTKGWKITEDKPDTEALFDDTNDGFSLSSQLIQLVKRPSVELLSEDQLVGLITFPVLLQVRSKLTDTAIKICTNPKIGYSLYVVFGSYLVIEQMVSIGIHESIMRVQNAKKVEIDTDKFTALLPYTKKEFPAWSNKLNMLYPSQPAKLRGAHYYCPLVPRELLGKNQISIQDWSFLQQ